MADVQASDPAPATAKVVTPADKPAAAELEEDDRFEEFDLKDWAIVNHEENQELYVADWEDDDITDGDFQTRLQGELDGKSMQTA